MAMVNMITAPPVIVSILGCSLITIHTQKGPMIVSNKKNKLTSSAEEVNLFFLLETIIGPFWVWMVIKEQPSIETITGGAVIIFTIAIHSYLKLKNS